MRSLGRPSSLSGRPAIAVSRISGAVVDVPLHIAHVATGRGADPVSYSRVLVVAGKGSEARIVETYSGPEGAVYLANAVTEVAVDDNATAITKACIGSVQLICQTR